MVKTWLREILPSNYIARYIGTTVLYVQKYYDIID